LPLLAAALFARTTGYIKARHVDIGDRVTEGQLLAEITAPDIDDQLAQAQANLAQSKANLGLAQANAELAKITLDRDVRTGPGTGVSQQQIDQDRATVATSAAQAESSKANIQVNEAAVQRFADLQGFQKIVPPVPGLITPQNIAPGDVGPADSPNTTKELFRIMRTDILRLFVSVPQVFATGSKVGQRALVYERHPPRKQFPGKVARTANPLDT